MKVIDKTFHQLKRGNVFVVLEVKGKRGEEINVNYLPLKRQASDF